MSDRKSVGIITFHCSNNYGAMLQAYGLKRFLRSKGLEVAIVRYEPVYMTGRHWWMPYVPLKGLKGRIWCVMNMWSGLWSHMKIKEEFSRQRANMARFRDEFLISKKQHRILSANMLKRLPYQYYVVGSDQIWNPDIAIGLRKAYFGAFENKRKKKVISYAASLGGAALAPEYDAEFSELIKYVDAVSVREEAAIPYVKRLCGRDVAAVLDPVFLLEKESWQKLERVPEKENFIFLYITEGNREMAAYARKLSQDSGLAVVEVRSEMFGTDAGFEVDYTAGPSEFLGYMHKAKYVVSNSFHAVAFCIIYQKKFMAFLHSIRGARVQNILEIHGLEDHLYKDDENSNIDSYTDWEEVRRKTKEHTRLSEEFLLKNICG